MRAVPPPAQAPLLVAPDKFKGTFRATEVAAAIGRGIEGAGLLPPDLCPVADGGDGTLDVLLTALGGETRAAEVGDALGRSLEASFGLIEGGGTAVVELAAASGLARLGTHELDAEAASSTGTGELILAAVEAGAAVVLLAPGGSASTDGGAGAIAAIEAGGGLRGAQIVVLCDVRTTFERAATTFGPQKGADAAAVRRLERRLAKLADGWPRDPRGIVGSGAGGGIAGGLWAALGAELVPGASFILDTLGFDARMRAARAVILGEGKLDRQTLEGKALGEAATRCRQAGVPCHAIVGRAEIDPFDARIIDLQVILEAGTLPAIETAARGLAERIAKGDA